MFCLLVFCLLVCVDFDCHDGIVLSWYDCAGCFQACTCLGSSLPRSVVRLFVRVVCCMLCVSVCVCCMCSSAVVFPLYPVWSLGEGGDFFFFSSSFLFLVLLSVWTLWRGLCGVAFVCAHCVFSGAASGIAAILRFPLPEIADSDDESDADSDDAAGDGVGHEDDGDGDDDDDDDDEDEDDDGDGM